MRELNKRVGCIAMIAIHTTVINLARKREETFQSLDGLQVVGEDAKPRAPGSASSPTGFCQLATILYNPRLTD